MNSAFFSLFTLHNQKDIFNNFKYYVSLNKVFKCFYYCAAANISNQLVVLLCMTAVYGDNHLSSINYIV